MGSIIRSSLPLRVHHIWDGIAQASLGSQKPVDFECLMAILTTAHKLPRDEMNRQLNLAIKDHLVVSDVIHKLKGQKLEETQVYSLPDPTFLKGDHDWYCFHCHLGGGGAVVVCENCPRIFHLSCLPDDRKPQKNVFVCPPCHIMATKPSAMKLNLKQKQLNTLLKYSCSEIKEWLIPLMNSSNGKVLPFVILSNRDAKEIWRYDYLVYFKIDLTQMLDKASNGKYSSLEEYQVDCETLIHGIGVYFGIDQLKIIASFHREVMRDIQEIKLCHDCFRRSNEKGHAGWFSLPCTTPHEVVWAKQSGYPYWPAKVIKVEGNKYDVRYFGGNHERGMIDAKNIQPISTPLARLRIRRNAAWNEAFDELEKFQEIARNPEKLSCLPTTKGEGGKNGTSSNDNAASKVRAAVSKRPSTKSSTEKVPNKIVRPSNTIARKSARVQSVSVASVATRGRSRKSAGTVNNSIPVNSSPGRTSRVIAALKKKSSGATLSHKRNSTIPPTAGRSRGLSNDSYGIPEILDAEDVSFLNSLEDMCTKVAPSRCAYLSNEEQDEYLDKVSESAVSSSVKEISFNRNVSIQTNKGGLTAGYKAIKESVIKHLVSVHECHAKDLAALKKKQWCVRCECQAILYCCWKTAYCSKECQLDHWTKAHRRVCRRERADN